jgi:hypothetical protein
MGPMDLVRRLRFLLLPLALLMAGMVAGAELATEEWEVPLSLEATQACPSPGLAPGPAGHAPGAVPSPVKNKPPGNATVPAARAPQPVRLLIHRFNE